MAGSKRVIGSDQLAPGRCPLLGVKRTLDGMSGMSAYDPKRTSVQLSCCNAVHSFYSKIVLDF